MKFPKLKPTRQSLETVTTFGGYNRGSQIREGEFYDMRNLSSDEFPAMSTRKPRQILEEGRWIRGLISSNGMCKVVEFQGHTPRGKVETFVQFVLPNGTMSEVELTPGNKELIAMGAYVIILPDRKWVNVAASLGQADRALRYGDLEAAYKASTLEFYVCDREGTPLNFLPAAEKPHSPEDGAYWLDNRGAVPVLMRWYEDQGLWQEEKSYLRIHIPQDAEQPPLFRKGDALQGPQIRGPMTALLPGQASGWIYIPADPVVEQIIPEEGGFGMVIPGIATCGTEYYTLEAMAEVDWARKMPDMDFLVESGNRLWGCKCGRTDKGFVNELYACALGDPTNWYRFQGISTDSYIASAGAEGPFTGAVNYLGKPIFFKENAMLRLYGDMPSNFRLQVLPCEGVRRGCEKSLAVVDGILYYKSRTDVCAFDGSVPVRVGGNLGQPRHSRAVAGGYGKKYYLSLEGAQGWELFVYDTDRRLWHKEDELAAAEFFRGEAGFFCLPENRQELVLLTGGEEPWESVSWMAQTGPMGLATPDARYISRIQLKLSLENGATARIFARYDDGNRGWEHLYTMTCSHLRSFTLPLRPRRSDHIYLKIEGTGHCRLHAITKVWEEGGLSG